MSDMKSSEERTHTDLAKDQNSSELMFVFALKSKFNLALF